MAPCEFPKAAGVYRIVNSRTGQFYVGSSQDLRNRLRKHAADLGKGAHHSYKLQQDWATYGAAAFSYELIMFCEKEELLEMEQAAIDLLSPQYNVCPTAGNSAGRPCPEHVKAILSQHHKGRKVSEETRARISAGIRKYLEDPEARRSMSTRQLGRVHSEATRALMSEKAKGSKKPKWTEERRAKAVASMKRAKGRPEAKEALAKRNREGARLSPDQVRYIRAKTEEGWPRKLSAAEFGISLSLVSLIVTRKSYSHVS